MRVLFVTPPSTARMYPLIPLAWALRSAGCLVHVASWSGFAPTINLTGLVAAPLGDPVGEPDRLAGPAVADAVTGYAGRWRPDLVVWDRHAPAADVAARVVGAASVQMVPVSDRLDGSLVDVDRATQVPDATLEPTPPSLRPAPVAGDLPIRHIPYHGPAIVPSWLRRRARRSRVIARLDPAGARLGELFEAVDGLDLELVCAVPMRELPPGVRIPGNVRILDATPGDALLRTCSALVHDGAAVADALAYGLPHLVPDGTAGAELGKRILQLTADPAVREEAERLRVEVLAMPGPEALVSVLTDLAGGRDRGGV
ncbi:DUF1205 domain-containing protein, partial [Micromonospora sp. KC207]|uniref:nucleotide disphospho-sugar-binding domain-containing protein n=1 Tax=Micromonospora sp. KC207 TaxID=2530377 RepID=UPI0010528274